MEQPTKEPAEWENQVATLRQELDTLVGEKRRVSWVEFTFLVGRYREMLEAYEVVRFYYERVAAQFDSLIAANQQEREQRREEVEKARRQTYYATQEEVDTVIYQLENPLS